MKGKGIVAHLFLVLVSGQQRVGGGSFLVMLVDISQWRVAIGCFRVLTCRSERFSCALSIFSVLLQILKLYQFAVCFILIAIVDKHKHLGIILDSKLSFSAHIQAAINKSRKAIGMLKFMSKYLPRNTLNELYKLYVRPHLDYGDVIYHIPQGTDGSENYMMEKLESVQYSAALAVTGTWRGTSQEGLHNELGWESLGSRRWSRHLILLYKFINKLTPDYTRDPIPPLYENNYPFRNPSVVGQIRARTEKFKSSFYPHSLSEWNKLDPEIRESSSASILKKKLFLRLDLLLIPYMVFIIQKGLHI